MKYMSAFERTVATVTLRELGLRLPIGMPAGRRGFVLFKKVIPYITDTYPDFIRAAVFNYTDYGSAVIQISFANPGFYIALKETIEFLMGVD